MIQKEWNLPGNLGEVVQSMTYREYLTRLAWLDMMWGQPELSDYYSMQTACEVRRVLSKNPNRVNIEDFILKFIPPDGMSSEDKARSTQRSKNAWLSILSSVKNKGNGPRETPS